MDIKEKLNQTKNRISEINSDLQEFKQKLEYRHVDDHPEDIVSLKIQYLHHYIFQITPVIGVIWMFFNLLGQQDEAKFLYSNQKVYVGVLQFMWLFFSSLYVFGKFLFWYLDLFS